MISCSSRISKISELHKSLEFNFSDDPEKTKDMLKRQLRAWLTDHVQIICITDTRERLPYTEKETGLKHVKQKNDTGDYCFYAEWTEDDGTRNTFDLGLIIERKGGDNLTGGPDDLYGTLMNHTQRERFYRELSRLNENQKMLIFAECKKASFMAYFPNFPKICKFCTKCERRGTGEKAEYFCVLNKSEPIKKKQNYTCDKINVRIRTVDEIKALLNSKRATIAGLEVSGIDVCWQGSRKESTLSVKPAAEQWILRNYDEVLDL